MVYKSFLELEDLVNAGTTVLKLAVDSFNLGLCDSRDYFACPLLIAQTKTKSCLLIALLIA